MMRRLESLEYRYFRTIRMNIGHPDTCISQEFQEWSWKNARKLLSRWLKPECYECTLQATSHDDCI